MRYLVWFVLGLAVVALPLSVSAQADDEGATSEPNLQETAPVSEPGGEEARAGDEHSLSFWHDEALKIALFSSSPAPSPETAPEEPALQLKLDDAGVEVVPTPPRTPDGYRLEEMELRVKRARRGLIGTSVILGLGVVLSVGAGVCSKRNPPSGEEFIEVSSCFGLDVGAFVLIAVGSIGMLVSGPVLGARKRKLRRLQEAHSGTPRRVQWDLAQSRLVF